MTKIIRHRLVLLLCSFIVVGEVMGQSGYELRINYTEEVSLPKSLEEYPSIFADSISATQAAISHIQALRSASYLMAEPLETVWEKQMLTLTVNPGPAFTWAKIKNGNIDEYLIQQSNVLLKRQEKKEVSPVALVELENRILEAAENSGYPFAKIFMDSLTISEDQISGVLRIEKGTFITFDEVKIIGDVNISPKYLQEYLGIGRGDPYNAKKINSIGTRMRELVFLEESKSATITFRGKSAIVNLFLKNKKASKTDLIFGVLPRDNSLNPVDRQRPLFTIDLTLDWNNRLGLGERLFFQFEQLRPQRQEGEFSITYPYILGLPFGVNGDLSIYRRDSLFLEVNSEIGLQYLFEGNNYIKAFWENRSTNLLQVDTNTIIASQRLPAQLDFNNALFGIEWQNQQLNYRFNPRKGWETKLRAGFGNKKVIENNDILALARKSFDPQIVYDSLNEKSWQVRMEGSIAGYLPLGKISTIKTSLSGGAIYSPAQIISNEQFRLGGNKILRGFDEENFTASVYAVGTIEYRLLIGTNSYIFLFGDIGYIEDSSQEKKIFDQPTGFGGGVTLETKVGIFGISLAFGSQNDLPLDLRKSKIHFGYLSLF